jgi:predicted component of type VI protein secretion system
MTGLLAVLPAVDALLGTALPQWHVPVVLTRSLLNTDALKVLLEMLPQLQRLVTK